MCENIWIYKCIYPYLFTHKLNIHTYACTNYIFIPIQTQIRYPYLYTPPLDIHTYSHHTYISIHIHTQIINPYVFTRKSLIREGPYIERTRSRSTTSWTDSVVISILPVHFIIIVFCCCYLTGLYVVLDCCLRHSLRLNSAVIVVNNYFWCSSRAS